MRFFKKKDVVILLLLILAPTIFFYSAKTMNLITGYVIYTEDVLPEVEQLALNHPLTRLAAPDSKICILINDGASSTSFNIDKIAKDDFSVSEAEYKYCDTAENEDFILEFLNYDSFKKQVNDNSCNSFKKGWGGTNYYFLISKFVKPGGEIICNDEFSNLYCSAIKFCYSNDEIEAYKLDCCSDYTPTEEINSIYDELITEGVNQGTTVRREEFEKQKETIEEEYSPTYQDPTPPSTNYLMLALIPTIFGIFAIGGLITLNILHHKKSSKTVDPRIIQLQNYITNTLKMGYTKEQLYYSLLQQGWSKDIVDLAFQNIYK